MGYSTNRTVLEARRHMLTELELGRACRWSTTPDPEVTRRTAYEIREALYIASLYPSEYPALARARRTFSLHIVGPGIIEAKPRGPSAPIVHLRDETPIHGLGPFGREVSTVGKTTAAEIIEAWQAHMPSLDAINFPQTTLPETELLILYDWSQRHLPKLMMLVGAGFLTLSLQDAEVSDFAWKPPLVPEKPEPKYDL